MTDNTDLSTELRFIAEGLEAEGRTGAAGVLELAADALDNLRTTCDVDLVYQRKLEAVVEEQARELTELKDRIGDLQASEWEIGYKHGWAEAGEYYGL